MIKKLSQYIGEYKNASIVTPLYIIGEAIMEQIIPLLMAMIVDNGIGKSDMGYVTKVGIIMVVVSIVSLTFGALAGKYAAKASAGFAKNLRKAMFYNIQDFSFSNIDKYSTAGLITRLTTDVTNVQNAYQMVLRMLVRAPIMLIIAMIMSFSINVKLALIFVGAMLFLGIILYFIMTKAHPYFKAVFEKYDDLNASVQENLTGMRVVKAYVREEHEIEKFNKSSKVLYDFFIRAEKVIVLNMPVMQFSMYTCMLLLSWLGAKMIVSSTMTTGELMSLFTYSMSILMSLMMIAMVFVMITMAKSSAERISEVIDEKSSLSNPENPVFEVSDGSIEFDNVNFSYGNNVDNFNLENINIKISSGETVGIIGGTGSAKSTFVQLIPRLYDVTEGSVKVGGIDVRKYDIETLRDAVSMVLQKNVLFSGTINENLRWGDKEATEEEIITACKQAQGDEFVQTFPKKYETYIEQGGTNVSGGQKQRLCIARALLKKPKILILDDSTSAVDTKTDALIRKAFKEDIPDTTKIIIAQRISSVQDADKIIVLNDGKIDGIGNHEELLKDNSIYREVYESQVKGADNDGK
ncbi:MAG: ABC transporter ATP-binding protein [Clostridium neonatale]|uniref:Multidrug ABC transporter ATPase n=1 Tax=Clostridium carnis TaxID=1530 RepID=A0ABY6SWB0_9CLOT|nr:MULTISPECIES: ABC transporter ATP-binding protein [Clostridium]CAI3540492.1 putative ABC transporter, ATP-binding/permease protein [Clostridium neonatale]CAI3549106.1 putative ABC transporter, ATP-binding/permease protein [Clostridium neonatale]CAI3572838.1 putative ABC transporter, ATP-binding/permease protein [Clostridium neonatale]CAI3597403.1 putative ABC transporter, ATP-binding/permease protein [Clostridium neonatale]CAI3607734.1 putative ABC transporter, ATP-binding/permease protein 